LLVVFQGEAGCRGNQGGNQLPSPTRERAERFWSGGEKLGFGGEGSVAAAV
jgi:hypothetical protein